MSPCPCRRMCCTQGQMTAPSKGGTYAVLQPSALPAVQQLQYSSQPALQPAVQWEKYRRTWSQTLWHSTVRCSATGRLMGRACVASAVTPGGSIPWSQAATTSRYGCGMCVCWRILWRRVRWGTRRVWTNVQTYVTQITKALCVYIYICIAVSLACALLRSLFVTLCPRQVYPTICASLRLATLPCCVQVATGVGGVAPQDGSQGMALLLIACMCVAL